MALIDPADYDLVVLGSGIPELLVASSSVKSGLSVLILEPVDTYGSQFASFSLFSLQHKIQQASSQDSGSAADSQAGCLSSEHERDQVPKQPALEPLPEGWHALPLHDMDLSMYNVEAVGAQSQTDLGLLRSYILDQAPKILYQAEPLVELLVQTRAHNYLEFKSVDNSYIWSNGQLTPVPASKSDIFKDRSLSLSDKRALMRFITNCTEAMAGQGPLKEVLNSDTPLHEVLQAEGLSEQLSCILLYAIAVCDFNQQPAPSDTKLVQQQPAAGAVDPAVRQGELSVSSCGTDATPEAAASQPQSTAGQASISHTNRQHANSVGHANSVAGVAAPCQQQQEAGAAGDGSLSRLTAKQGAAALHLFMESVGRFGTGGAFMCPTFGCGSVAEAFVRFCAVQGAVTVLRHPAQALLLTADGECAGVLTNSGQIIRCKQLVANSTCLSSLPPQPPPQQVVSRALAILDNPVVQGQQTLTLVIPPGTSGLNNVHAIRAVQLGPALAVSPPGRYLLYLSTPASSTSAQSELQAALTALVDTSNLQQHSSLSQAESTLPDSQDPSSHAQSSSQAQASSASSTVPTNTGHQASKPKALQVCYYQQSVVQPLPQSQLPKNVICTAGPDGSLVGYVGTVQHAQAVVERLLGVTWIGNTKYETNMEPEKEDEDAIDDLQSALVQLNAAGVMDST